VTWRTPRHRSGLIACVVKQDVDVATDGALTYRIKLSVSFK
jgi:hypothetical protein